MLYKAAQDDAWAEFSETCLLLSIMRISSSADKMKKKLIKQKEMRFSQQLWGAVERWV